MTARAAVFLDRDGTLIEDPPPGFINDPSLVRPLRGAVEAVARLAGAGMLPIVVTNQSGIARGFISEAQYQRVAARVEEVFGGRIAATMHCPHYPPISGGCACRKPGVALYREAGRTFDLDFTSSWWVGDRLSDVEPARILGGRGILLTTDDDAPDDEARSGGFQTASDIGAAVATILSSTEGDRERSR